MSLLATRHFRNWARLPIDYKDPSLVLYLPLWYPYSDMSGGPAYSYDRNRHTATVTGATWGLQGRTFDGVDDTISVAANAAFDFGSGDFTGLIWVKWTSLTVVYRRILSRVLVGDKWILRKADNNKWDIYCNDGVNEATVQGSTVVAGNWNMVGIRRTGTTFDILLNDTVDASISNALFGSLDQVGADINIGGSEGEFLNGVCGEVFSYNRALSLAEIQQIYQRTKWRYL